MICRVQQEDAFIVPPRRVWEMVIWHPSFVVPNTEFIARPCYPADTIWQIVSMMLDRRNPTARLRISVSTSKNRTIHPQGSATKLHRVFRCTFHVNLTLVLFDTIAEDLL